ncbi:hypothetical protein AMTRI_Chr12g270160 [Amborella trichopoda]
MKGRGQVLVFLSHGTKRVHANFGYIKCKNANDEVTRASLAQHHCTAERNCRKGQFCPNKLMGKRAIELGAGCGLAGFGMTLLGCNVISTDQKEVLPLPMRNVERNIWRIKQANLNVLGI